MVAQYLGPFNGKLPTHEASGKLVVDFSRNVKKFALPRYCQYVPTGGKAGARENQGYYYSMGLDEAVRMSDSDGNDAGWADGAPRPSGTVDETFDMVQFRTRRYERGFRVGFDTANLANWDVLAQRAAMASSRLMTLRTAKVAAKLTTTGNYASTHYSAVASMSGASGTWAQSTTARSDIKRTLLNAAEIINLDTNGVVGIDDLRLVMSPTDARQVAQTQEIIDMLKHSPEAAAYIKDATLAGSNLNAQWGLPPKLYGIELCIEDAVKNTARKGATTSKSRVWPTGSAVLMSRIGALEGVAGAPSFSSITLFMREEMNVETNTENWNRRHLGSVVDDYFTAFTAPISSFLFTNIIS